MLGPEGESGWQRGKDKMFLRNGVLEVLEAAMRVSRMIVRACATGIGVDLLEAR